MDDKEGEEEEEERKDIIFEVADKTGRKIRLTRKQWTHIRVDHPEVESEEVIQSIKTTFFRMWIKLGFISVSPTSKQTSAFKPRYTQEVGDKRDC